MTKEVEFIVIWKCLIYSAIEKSKRVKSVFDRAEAASENISSEI